ncbi:MAG: ABC transporter ATP-binding protein [Candidatus Krumholzibacteria bacterium]|nr:ABC transporter ATP-binding protein [Candidatus Krumholzibacteria bacterium]
MPQIVLENICKYYNGFRALENITVTIEDNATTAIVGPSGGGKSTLIQLINGLVRPDRGRVVVFGEPIDYNDLPRLRRQIGYAVQGTGLFPHMKVWDNITLLAKLADWDRSKTIKRAECLMDLVDLSRSLKDRYPHELSGGEQQRVGLCRAMMLNPKIFLLDEPFAALDPITRDEIHGEFLSLQKSEARTVVMVTHDLREALRLARRLVILKNGMIIQENTREQVLRNPANEFVKSLVHSQLENWSLDDIR